MIGFSLDHAVNDGMTASLDRKNSPNVEQW
jgi:hypothetical protein